MTQLNNAKINSAEIEVFNDKTILVSLTFDYGGSCQGFTFAADASRVSKVMSTLSVGPLDRRQRPVRARRP